MTHRLAIGDRAYSSWSLRGWLLFDAFGIAVETRSARLYSDDLGRVLADFVPARTVPAARLADGTVVWDSLAIAETLHDRYPQAGIWPADPALRALARSLAAEMHSSFTALRGDCPMNLRASYADFAPAEGTLTDLRRIEDLWAHARARIGGPWLAGDYSAADAFFAPVATRIATYGLPVSGPAAAYVAAHLAHPSFRRWRAQALVDGPDQPFYARPHLTPRPWPGP